LNKENLKLIIQFRKLKNLIFTGRFYNTDDSNFKL